jgi:hypothetical protein
MLSGPCGAMNRGRLHPKRGEQGRPTLDRDKTWCSRLAIPVIDLEPARGDLRAGPPSARDRDSVISIIILFGPVNYT